MRTTVNLTALLALLLGGAALGQPPQPPKQAPEKKPSKLEELIAQALKDNPDVRVAEAKLREAEAELNRARLQVIQKVVTLQNATEAAAPAVTTAEARYKAAEAALQLTEVDSRRLQNLVEKKLVPQSEVDTARAKRAQAEAAVQAAKAELQTAKAEQARLQADMQFLLGKQPRTSAELELNQKLLYLLELSRAEADLAAAMALAKQPRGTVADTIRKALDKPIRVKYADTPLGDVLKQLQEHVGVSLLDNTPRELRDRKVRLDLAEPVPLGAAFQALEDIAPIHFAVREYGLLVSDKLPAGVMPLHVFWKGGEAPRKTPPGKDPQGKVLSVDESGRLVEVSVGSDDGVKKGDTLELYRTEPRPVYLGKLQIVEVAATMAVGKVTGPQPVRAGDRVAGRLADQ